LVDLTPDDLIQRLRDGKVYVPRQAERALDHFFAPANLTALRELALRRTAERVDEQLLTQMQAGAISGPWAAGERILVCISEDRAQQASCDMPSDWPTGLHGPGRPSMSRAGAVCSSTTRIAIELPTPAPGRISRWRSGHSPERRSGIADDVIGYAQAYNVTQIIIGKIDQSRWFEILHGSVVHDLVRRSGNISVNVIAGDAVAGEPIAKKTVRTAELANSLDPRSYLIALVAVTIALGNQRWRSYLGLASRTSTSYSSRRGRCAVRYGLWPSLFASAAASLCYNFFSCADLYVHDRRSHQRGSVFLLHCHGGHRLECSGASTHAGCHGNRAARTTESLYAFSRKLAGAGTLDDVLWATAYQTA